jgi:hypothetical protein
MYFFNKLLMPPLVHFNFVPSEIPIASTELIEKKSASTTSNVSLDPS